MNVQEIINISKERKRHTKAIVARIMEMIHKRIKHYALMKYESCIYTISPILNDAPIFEFETVIKDVYKKLDSEGFICTAYPSGQLDISWNEKLVEQKIKTDHYLLTTEEKKLRSITKKSKQVEERFSMLANPEKTNSIIEKSASEQLDEQIEKILGERNKLQKKYSKLLKK